MWSWPPPTNASKIHLHVEQFSWNTYWKPAEDLVQPKLQEQSPHNQVGWRGKGEEEESGQELCPWEGAVKEEMFPNPRNLFHQLRGPPRQIESFRGLRGECGSWPVLHRVKRDQHRRSWSHHHLSQCKTRACWCAQWLGLQGTDPGRGLDLAAQRQSKGREVCPGRQLGVHTGQAHVCGRSPTVNKEREGGGSVIAASLSACS